METKSRKKDLRSISWPNKSRGAKAIKDSRHVTKHFAETSWAELQKLTVFNFRISIKFQRLKKMKVSKPKLKVSFRYI